MDRRAKHELITDFIVDNREFLYRLAYSYVRNQDDALDVLQDSICKALSNAKSLKDAKLVKTWCCRIVVNAALDFLRKRKKLVALSDTEEAAEISHDVYQDFDLNAAMEGLTPRNRAIVFLRFYEGLKLEEIAEILGENLNTTKTALYSSLKTLRLQLDEPGQ